MSGAGKAAKPAVSKTKAAAAKGKKMPEAPRVSPLMPPRPKNLRVGGAVRPAGRDLTRFVKWPRYVRVQRQRKVLYERLKIPPAINQFLKPLDRAEAAPIFKLLEKYRPESKAEKKVRLDKEAVARAAPGADAKAKVGPAPVSLKFGLNHVTHLVEEKKAKLVGTLA